MSLLPEKLLTEEDVALVQAYEDALPVGEIPTGDMIRAAVEWVLTEYPLPSSCAMMDLTIDRMRQGWRHRDVVTRAPEETRVVIEKK